MDGYLLGWGVTLAVLGGLALVFVLAAWSMPRSMASRTAEIYCPRHRRRVTVRLVADGEDPMGTTSCTAFGGAPCPGGRDHLLMDTERPAELAADRGMEV